ncbi:TPA: hypothetical protein P0E27_003498 [Vibrio harveyi]|nr:hypothetical protein [Vibrio harveyi]
MGRVGRKKKMKALRKALGIASKQPIRKVFDNFERTDASPMRNIEADFDFYNRSARPAMGLVRNTIEKAVQNYPDSEVDELIARFRSRDNVHFRSASFELFLHEALRKQGFVLIPHPELPNGSPYKPDFLVQDVDGNQFYLEAVLATENNELDKGGEARKGAVLDTLSRAPHKNFFIAIDDDGSPKSPPSGKKLKGKIHRWLDSLDPDDISKQIEESGLDSIPPLIWSHDGWSLQIRPMPIKPERRGKSTNLVGMGGIGGGWIDAWSPIRDAVKFKGGKYGDLDLPLVVAVNLKSFHLDRIDEMQAFFGQEQYVFTPGKDADPEMQRAPNGAWYGKQGPQYTRVSAVWIFNDLHASSLATRKSTVYLNPWAVLPAPDSLKCFPFAFPEQDKMEWSEGLSLREIFELHEEWPENA